MAASIQLIIQRRQEISLCCARLTKFLPFLFFHSFFFFYELREKISKRRNLYISKEGNIFISAVFSVIQLFSIIPSQILSLPYIIFSPKETRRNFILSNQPTNVSIRSLSCIVTSKVWSEKRHLPSSQTSPHKPFPRGQGTDVADSSPRNPPSPSTAKLFVVKGDFSRTK